MINMRCSKCIEALADFWKSFFFTGTWAYLQDWEEDVIRDVCHWHSVAHFRLWWTHGGWVGWRCFSAFAMSRRSWWVGYTFIRHIYFATRCSRKIGCNINVKNRFQCSSWISNFLDKIKTVFLAKTNTVIPIHPTCTRAKNINFTINNASLLFPPKPVPEFSTWYKNLLPTAKKWRYFNKKSLHPSNLISCLQIPTFPQHPDDSRSKFSQILQSITL